MNLTYHNKAVGEQRDTSAQHQIVALRPYYTAQLIVLTIATELQQLLGALLHTGNQ